MEHCGTVRFVYNPSFVMKFGEDENFQLKTCNWTIFFHIFILLLTSNAFLCRLQLCACVA